MEWIVNLYFNKTHFDTLLATHKIKNPVTIIVHRVFKYSRRESNPHSRKNWILNPARLPVPPLEHYKENANL